MHIATKIKIPVTPVQADVLCHLSEKCRLLYNFALAERNQNYQENRDRPDTQSVYRVCSAGQRSSGIEEEIPPSIGGSTPGL
ncbi:helix-turn-helix domain-containing protein [Methanoculleus sp. UBA340]